jgi:Bacterial Ig-like domain (group 3)
MSLNLSSRRRSGLLALTLASGLAVSSLVAAGPANAIVPPGSRAEVILETGDVTADPDNAITAGWWGHEGGVGPAGTGSTYLSLNGADGSGNVTPSSLDALRTALGTTDLANVFYAIVPYTPDGSNEAPAVNVGDNAAEAFAYVMDAGFGSSLSGNTQPNDSIITVSTLSQISAWVAAGQPAQGYDSSLVLHDVTAPGSPVATAPQGTSILNTWPAGTQLSLVAYVAEGRDVDLNNVVPLVKRGGDGKAQTAWMPFTTVANPSSAIRTSAGYQVMGAQKPLVTVSDSFTGSSGTVSVTVRNGSAVATNATGTVEFRQVVGGVPGAPTSVTTTNGVATLPVTLAPGGLRTYDVKYVPDAPGSALYVASDTVRYTVINEVVTATSLKVTGTDTYTVTATVTPASAAGNVAFFDGSKSLGSGAVSGGKASVKPKLAAGKHTLKAVFDPSDTTFKGSTGTTTVWAPKIVSKVSPAPKVGKKSKLKITIDTPGTKAGGQVKVKVKAPGGKPKTFTVTVKNGKAKVNLPATVKGKTKITIEYLGSGAVLAATAKTSFKV